MNKLSKSLLIFILFIFIFFVYPGQAIKIDSVAPSLLDEKKIDKIEPAKPSGRKPQPALRPKVEYKAYGLRNPFEQPALGPVVEARKGKGGIKDAAFPVLIVQGVIWDGSPRQAIINNKLVQVGDTIEGADIIEINKEGVTVLFAGVEEVISTFSAKGQQASTKIKRRGYE
ncbi:MAG: hypothetical protein FJZ12_04735 [Candidatus Omnitrophica bacterium]|nr:hypothetical protein [Candidatus Omnitrophota bacterium]